MSTPDADRVMRIRFLLDPTADDLPAAEVVHATLVAPGEARIDDVPFFVPAVALHDVVTFTPDGDADGLFGRVVARSGHGVLTAAVSDDATAEALERVFDDLDAMHGRFDGVLVADLRDAAALDAVLDRLPPALAAEAVHVYPPQSALEQAAGVMARVRDHCVWTQQITHDDLVPYLIEESAEVVEAVEHGTRADLREELGDLLWQVFFHAEIASRDPEAPFGIEDVAHDLADKMVRRHPHVFAGETAATPEEVLVHWNAAKAAEKRERTSVLDGIPAQMPALARAQKVVGRGVKLGVAPASTGVEASAPAADEASLGDALLGLVGAAQAAGLDAERALRAATRRFESRVQAAESPETQVSADR